MEFSLHDYLLYSFYRDYHEKIIVIKLISEDKKLKKELKITNVLFSRSTSDYEGCIILDAGIVDFNELVRQYTLEEILKLENGGLLFSECDGIIKSNEIVQNKNLKIFRYNSSYGQYGYIFYTGDVCLTIA